MEVPKKVLDKTSRIVDGRSIFGFTLYTIPGEQMQYNEQIDRSCSIVLTVSPGLRMCSSQQCNYKSHLIPKVYLVGRNHDRII